MNAIVLFACFCAILFWLRYSCLRYALGGGAAHSLRRGLYILLRSPSTYDGSKRGTMAVQRRTV